MIGYIEFVPESIGMSEIMYMAGMNYPANPLGTSRVFDPKALQQQIVELKDFKVMNPAQRKDFH